MGRASSGPRLAALAGFCAALVLSGCIGNSVFDDLNSMEPVGSAFNEALFKNYSYLAKSFGVESSPVGQAFDADAAISLTGSDNTISGLANGYAQKALAAGRGDDVMPEPATDGDADAENVRLELLRDLDDGRDKAPDDAARAQAEYDCWIMNRRVDELQGAAQACRRGVTAALSRLEHSLNPTASAPPPSSPLAPAPVSPVASAPLPTAAPAPAPAQSAEFTVPFGYRSARLASDDQFTVVAQAIAAARNGRQSHINVVGHIDAGENSLRLAVERATAVKDALVARGARADAISVSGANKEDVKDPKNRRAVITLVP